MLLEPQCTGPITSSRHPLCLEIAYFVFKRLSRITYSGVRSMGKFGPTKLNSVQDFFLSVTSFWDTLYYAEEWIDKNTTAIACSSKQSSCDSDAGWYYHGRKSFTGIWRQRFYLLFSDMLYIRRTIKTVTFTLRLKSSFVKERDPRSNGLYLDYQL